MKLKEFNSLKEAQAQELMRQCCGASKWVKRMVELRPFDKLEQLKSQAEIIWGTLNDDDVKEVFDYHPKIGDISSLKKKIKESQNWSEDEQSEMDTASEKTIAELAEKNLQYEKKFGFIFLIFATGKTPTNILKAINIRMKNSVDEEIINVRLEQNKITLLRLDKLFK